MINRTQTDASINLCNSRKKMREEDVGHLPSKIRVIGVYLSNPLNGLDNDGPHPVPLHMSTPCDASQGRGIRYVTFILLRSP